MTQPLFQLSSPSTLHKPTGYSHLGEVQRGRLIYVAGQVAMDAAGNLVGKDDLRAQVTQVFVNLKAALESAGGSCADIVKLNYFCCDRVPASEIAVVREVRNQFLNPQAMPVSTFVFVSRLVHPDWLIEVEAVAVLDGGPR